MIGANTHLLNNGAPASYSIIEDRKKPQDTVSCLAWFGNFSSSFGGHLFVCSSWDSKIRLYGVSEAVKAIMEMQTIETEHPCLSIACNPSTPILAAGCIDNSVKTIDPSRDQSTNIGHHDDPVKDVYWLDENLVLSTSFDKTVRVWDIRARDQTAVSQLKLNYKITCSDAKGRLVALGLEGSRSIVFDYTNTRQEVFSDERSYYPSPFDEQQEINCITLFHDLKGFSVGSTAGRADISELIDQPGGGFAKNKIITFKCLKDDSLGYQRNATLNLYPVHVVAFNPVSKYNLITAGSNGKLHFWDYQTRIKNSTINTNGVPITKAIYSPDGRFVLYATGYDWGSGIEKSMLYKTNITAYPIKEEDLVKKK